ncbi:MAG: hypothetical protein O2943_04225 [Actinomycetota bacterium]|nr:hypothetical protein [Actinomycetota bacterium]
MSDFEGTEIDDDTPAFRGLSRRRLLASAAASTAGIAAIKGAGPAAAQDYPLIPFKSRGRLTRRLIFLVVAVTAFALIAAAPASAAPSVASARSVTEKCGKPKKNQDGSIRNVLCPNGKANSQVRKYLAGQSPLVMQLGADATIEDLHVAVCGDIDDPQVADTFPILLNAYTYIHAANHFKAPLPTVKKLGKQLSSDNNPLGCA